MSRAPGGSVRNHRLVHAALGSGLLPGSLAECFPRRIAKTSKTRTTSCIINNLYNLYKNLYNNFKNILFVALRCSVAVGCNARPDVHSSCTERYG